MLWVLDLNWLQRRLQLGESINPGPSSVTRLQQQRQRWLISSERVFDAVRLWLATPLQAGIFSLEPMQGLIAPFIRRPQLGLKATATSAGEC